MHGEDYRFGGGASTSTIHPVVLVALCLGLLMMFCLRRKWVLVPFLVLVFLVPAGQVLVIGGVHFMIYRVAAIAGFTRIVLCKLTGRCQFFPGGFTTIDKLIFAWAICGAAAFVALYHTSDAYINQAGFLVDVLETYLVLRWLLQTREDVRMLVSILVVIAIAQGVCMVNEQLTMRNFFGVLGGVPLAPAVREGRIRSQGIFQHAILAGVFGATLAPLTLWLWTQPKKKILAGVGFAAATAMVFTSASSTPLLAYLGGILGLCLWPIRRHMRMIRYGLVLTVVGFACVMNAPVWFIIAHVNLVGSSSGYQRAMLIDQFMRHFSDWWLLGANSNQDWGFDMWDVQNQFLAQGASGGLLSLILFIAIVSQGFGQIGIARRLSEWNRKTAWFCWFMGAVLFSHVIAFFGSNYFDQTKVWWLANLAIIAALCTPEAVMPRQKSERSTSQKLECAA